jgi:hypothetical protein
MSKAAPAGLPLRSEKAYCAHIEKILIAQNRRFAALPRIATFASDGMRPLERPLRN